ncbi:MULTISPECIES: phage virion morphogenesis protein [Acinetobacter]|uniref:Virion morphogenesis protein n=1 Tax=Acinetobacter piscicola TaxID=2006115 RepID=A0A7S7AH47_9GAMM|nr:MULTISPECIES: phage virion morphogenesis protein [Acinetobacter]QOW46055.1 virion morphogenesis protein [Acinetobacter piscicola]
MANSIQMHGQDKLIEFMRRVEQQVADPSDLWRDIGDILVHNTEERFYTGIGTDDKPWQKSWRAQEKGGQTLRKDGHLIKSIIARVQRNKINVGTNLIYAPLMHFGGVVKPKKGEYLKFKTPLGGWVQLKSVTIPARPFLGISVDDSQEILFEIEEYLREALNNAK